MSWEAWFTLAIIAIAIVVMAKEWLQPALAVCGAVGVLLIAGVLTPERALTGFASPPVVIVGMLLVLAHSLERSRLVPWMTSRVLGRRGGRTGLLRALPPIAALSAFITNTTIVSVLTPAVRQWARDAEESPSKLLMPISFVAILGGTWTLVGTSTNLVVDGLLQEMGGRISMFELAAVGIPMTVAGILFLATFGYKLVPAREDPIDTLSAHSREYVAQFEVQRGCRLIGKRVQNLRHLENVFLAAVERKGDIVSPVHPRRKIRSGDTLYFVGMVDQIAEVASIEGLQVVTDPYGASRFLEDERTQLIEAVVSPSSPLANVNIRDAQFRSRYDAVVLAVHRQGSRVLSKVGDIVIRAGDVLLLLAGRDFTSRFGQSKHFYLVSSAGPVPAKLNASDWVEPVILALVVAIPALGIFPLLHTTIAGVGVLIVLRRMRAVQIWSALHWPTLATIGGSIAIGRAVEDGGLAAGAGGLLLDVAPYTGLAAVAVMFIATSILSEFINNAAAATLMFPIAVAATAAGSDPHLLAIAITLGASTCFASPIGYHTNIIVAGAGNYRFADFVKVGILLKIVTVAVGVAAIGLVYLRL